MKTMLDVAAPEDGAIAIGPFGSSMKADTYTSEGVAVIRGTNISDTRAWKGDWVYISDHFAKSMPRCALVADDIVFPHRGSIGEVAIVPADGQRYFLSSSLMKVRVNTQIAHPLFIYYYFRSDLGRSEILQYASQVGTPGIGQPTSSLKKFNVPCPPIDRQKAIADVLVTLDDKIELNRQMNATLEKMARALFRDWFVDFGPTRAKMEGREPYFAPELWSLFPDEIDETTGLPKTWESESIYDQADWINGAAYKNMHFSESADALPVIKIAELKAGVTAQTKRTNTALGDKYLIGSGELLFSWSGNPDTSLDAFIWTNGPAWLNQHIFAVRENGKRDRAFLYFMLKSFMSEFAEIARDKQTTGLGHVTKADLQRLTLCVGVREVCKEYSRYAGPLLDRMISNQSEIRELIETRDYLLPRLMSGEITVRDAEKSVSEAA